MTILGVILAFGAVAGICFAFYFSKIVRPQFEAEMKKTELLIRELLPSAIIHYQSSPQDVHLTYLGKQFTIIGPNRDDFEEGGPQTNVFANDVEGKAACVWKRFHKSTVELNTFHFREALEAIKAGNAGQPIEPTSKTDIQTKPI